MKKVLAKELKIKFVETLNKLGNFSYEDGNPFLIKIGSKQYFIFLKNLSPAFFKRSPDVTRVQLPYSAHFLKITNADIPFVILGYDIDNDTMVCWNPKKIKERLNAKGNVSLYSRESLQLNVKFDDFQSGYLSNGEKIIIFKREMLLDFFPNLNHLFTEKKIDKKENTSLEPVIEYVSNKLSEITDKVILNEIKPLLKKNKVLAAVDICSKHYKNRYSSMTFKDWYKLVNQLYQKQ